MLCDVFSNFDIQKQLYIYAFFFYMILIFQSVFSKRFSFAFNTAKIGNFKYSKFCNVLMFVFFFILLENFVGLLPFSISLSSHMELTLLLSSMLFFIILLVSFSSSISGFFSHLMPYSCPLGLSIFLFLVEVISLFIRPMTLALRLGAKMTSGHILLGMVMGVGLFMPFFFFEMFVCFIQVYIFCTLVLVYIND